MLMNLVYTLFLVKYPLLPKEAKVCKHHNVDIRLESNSLSDLYLKSVLSIDVIMHVATSFTIMNGMNAHFFSLDLILLIL